MLPESDFPPLPSQRKTKTSIKQSDGDKASRQVTSGQRPATTLTDLPDELLIDILDYLPDLHPKNQLRGFVNLSLTNRRLHHIVRDRLYAVFDPRFCKPYLYLRTMVSNPSLASHVKSASFTHKARWKIRGYKAYVPSLTDKGLIKEGFRQLDLPNWKKRASDCNEAITEQDVLCAAVLMHTPNVESMNIEDSDSRKHWLRDLQHVVNRHAIGRMHRFEHLKSIRIEAQWDLELIDLGPVFRLQSMRTVILVRLTGDSNSVFGDLEEEEEIERLRRQLPPRTSMVEDLQLEQSCVEDRPLHVLLSCMRNLKAFRISPYPDHDMDTSYDPNSYRNVVKALSNHSMCLERFSWDDARERPGHNGPSTDLSKFSRLAHVQIPVALLVTDPKFVKAQEAGRVSDLAEKLPPSVESLTLVWWGKGQKDALDYFILNCEQYAPSLRKLKVVHRKRNERPAGLVYQRVPRLPQDKDMTFTLEEEEDEHKNRWSWKSSTESDTSGEESLYSD